MDSACGVMGHSGIGVSLSMAASTQHKVLPCNKSALSWQVFCHPVGEEGPGDQVASIQNGQAFHFCLYGHFVKQNCRR